MALVSASEPTQPTAVFEDNFHTGLNQQIWTVNGAKGKLQYGSEGLVIGNSDDCKNMQSVTLDPAFLPPGGDWNLTINFVYNGINSYGSGLELKELGSGKSFCRVWLDNGGQNLWIGDAAFSPVDTTGWPSYPAQLHVDAGAPNMCKLTISDSGNRYTISINDKQLGVFTSDKAFELELGNDAQNMGNPGPWSILDVADVKIAYFDKNVPNLVAKYGAQDKTGDTNIKIVTPQGNSTIPDWVSVFSGSSATVNLPVGFDDKGNPVINGHFADVTVGPSQRIYFDPDKTHIPSGLSMVGLSINGSVKSTKDLLAPSDIIESYLSDSAAPGDFNLSELGLDGSNNQTELIRATLHVRPELQPVQFSLSGENAVPASQIQDGDKLFLFSGNSLLGSLSSDGKLNVAPLHPGVYLIQELIAKKNGTFVFPGSTRLLIPHRFDISCDADGGTSVLDDKTTKVGLSVKYDGSQKVKQLKFFVNGIFTSTSDGDTFKGNLDLSGVPSGPVLIGVAGVTDGNGATPIETHTIQIINRYYDELIANSPDGQKLQDLQRQLADLNSQISFWYEKGVDTPDFYTVQTYTSYLTIDEFGDLGSLEYLDEFQIPSDASLDFANCRQAMTKRGDIEIQIGELQMKLKLYSAAKLTFDQVIRQLGAQSADGIQATADEKKLPY